MAVNFKTITDGENEAIVYDLKSDEEALNFWTPERMKKAKPIGFFESSDVEVSAAAEIADIGKMPFEASGKIFFTFAGDYYCGSAQYCVDKRMILTAAHCLRRRSDGCWAENIVFYRGYKDGEYTQKVPVHSAAIKSYWMTEGKNDRWVWDYGFAVTQNESQCGALRYKTFKPESMNGGTATAFGYPGNYHDGNIMVYVKDAYTKENETRNLWCMTGTMLEQGASGGAWTDDMNTVVGLNSCIVRGENSMYSPIFTENEFESLVAYAEKLIN